MLVTPWSVLNIHNFFFVYTSVCTFQKTLICYKPTLQLSPKLCQTEIKFSFLKSASMYIPRAVKANIQKSDCGLYQCFQETYQKQEFVEHSTVVECSAQVIPSYVSVPNY
jgi:hypothetical protein